MPATPVKRRLIRPWMIAVGVALVVLVAAVLSTKVVTIEDAEAAESVGRFDPVEYADARFDSEIVPQIQTEAVDLATLLGDLENGADEAEFGQTPGAGSAYSFPVEFTGVAGAPNGSILPVTVEGVPAGVTVQVQIGPAINGTALRDVTGTVSFNEFTNQLEFQEVATEFNNRVRADALSGVDPAQLEGKTVHVVGAYTRVNPALVSVVPIVFEVEQ
jgi:predicted lipoprotein